MYIYIYKISFLYMCLCVSVYVKANGFDISARILFLYLWEGFHNSQIATNLGGFPQNVCWKSVIEPSFLEDGAMA